MPDNTRQAHEERLSVGQRSLKLRFNRVFSQDCRYMKRRSARPFVVEVKSTRSSRSPLADTFTRTRSGPSLWHGVALEGEAKSPAPKIQPRSAAAVEVPKVAAQEPARRVLPALMPLYVPSEPEPQERESRERVRSRRVVTAGRKPRSRPVVAETSDRPVRAAGPETSSAPSAAVAAPAILGPLQARVAPAIPPRLDRRDRDQRHPELRRGERWKRRLPRACW